MSANVWTPNARTVPIVDATGAFKEEQLVAEEGQRVFTIISFTFAKNTGSLLVFKNGKKLSKDVDYIEANTNSIILMVAANKFDTVLFLGLINIKGVVVNDIVLRNELISNSGASILGYQLTSPDAEIRTAQSKFNESVSVSDFKGAKAHNKFLNALTYLNENGGGTLRVNRGQAYVFEEGVISPILENDIILLFEPGSSIAAAVGLSVPPLHFRASDTAITQRSIHIQNPTIDCSKGITPAGDQGCSAISAQYFKQLTVNGINLYGGEDPSTSTADSGITPIACDYVSIRGGVIRGFSDGGIYAGGDNTVGASGNGTAVIIENVAFERCNNAILAKRELQFLRAVNNNIKECSSGIITAEITDPAYVPPPIRVEIQGNTFKKIMANVSRFRGPVVGAFNNNFVEDWGYKFDGTSPAGANGYALTIQGAKGISVNNNTFKLKDWPANDQRAVLLDNVTLNSVVYNQGDHRFTGNSYITIPRVLVEAAGGSASTYINEYYENITTAKYSGLHADSFISFKEFGKRGLWLRSKGKEFKSSPEGVSNNVAGFTLTSDDSGGIFTNSGAAAQIVATLPAAAVDLKFTFTGLMSTGGLKVQAVGNDLIRNGALTSTAAGSITTTEVGASLTLRAYDSTNWVVESSTGTWTLA
jgi:hypothetical protein